MLSTEDAAVVSENDQPPGINTNNDVSVASHPSNHHEVENDSNNSNMLSKSISSAFFKNLRLSGDATRKSIDHHPSSSSSSSSSNNHHVKPVTATSGESGVGVSVVSMGHRSEIMDSHDNASLPPPPTRQQQKQQHLSVNASSSSSIDGSIINASGFTNISMEYKRRETAAAVAQMKDRLRSMGILESTEAGGRKGSSVSRSNNTAQSMSSIGWLSCLFSPLPYLSPQSCPTLPSYDAPITPSNPFILHLLTPLTASRSLQRFLTHYINFLT